MEKRVEKSRLAAWLAVLGVPVLTLL